MEEPIVTTVTTEWHSAFDLNNSDAVAWTSSSQTIFLYDGVYYWIVSAYDGRSSDNFASFTIPTPFSALYYYDSDSGQWIGTGESLDYPFIDRTGYHFDSSQIVAQSWNDDILSSSYYDRSFFDSRTLPAPMGNSFDSIYLFSPLSEVCAVLPSFLAVIIVFLAIRKGISFIKFNLKGV